MLPHYFVLCLFGCTGAISVSAALFGWEWFFGAQNTQFLVRSIGKRNTRIFYGILGLFLMGTAFYLFFQR